MTKCRICQEKKRKIYIYDNNLCNQCLANEIEGESYYLAK